MRHGNPDLHRDSLFGKCVPLRRHVLCGLPDVRAERNALAEKCPQAGPGNHTRIYTGMCGLFLAGEYLGEPDFSLSLSGGGLVGLWDAEVLLPVLSHPVRGGVAYGRGGSPGVSNADGRRDSVSEYAGTSLYPHGGSDQDGGIYGDAAGSHGSGAQDRAAYYREAGGTLRSAAPVLCFQYVLHQRTTGWRTNAISTAPRPGCSISTTNRRRRSTRPPGS